MKRAYPSTFSIVARDGACWGVAVESKFLAVGPVVPWAQAGVGALATQAMANTGYGPRGLTLLARGLSAQAVVDTLTSTDEGREQRQLGVVDAAGTSASFTGKACFDWAGSLTGEGYACQGNILAGQAVVQGLAEAFEQSAGKPLAERLIAALRAGQAAGGDKRGQQSAALLVVKEKGGYGGYTDHLVNLRVDDHPAPIEELARLYGLQQLYFGQTSETVNLEGGTLVSVQTMLNKLGYYDGTAHGHLDEPTQRALDAFCGTENLEMRQGEDPYKLDVEILTFMQNRVG